METEIILGECNLREEKRRGKDGRGRKEGKGQEERDYIKHIFCLNLQHEANRTLRFDVLQMI